MKCPPSLSLSLSLSLCCSLALSLSLSLPLSIYLCMPMCARLHAHHAHARKRPRALFTRAKYPQAMPLQKHECTTRCSAPPAPSCMPHSPAHIGTHGRTDACTHGRMHARARARARTHTHTHTHVRTCAHARDALATARNISTPCHMNALRAQAQEEDMGACGRCSPHRIGDQGGRAAGAPGPTPNDPLRRLRFCRSTPARRKLQKKHLPPKSSVRAPLVINRRAQEGG